MITEVLERLQNTTLSSSSITHGRLKYFSSIAQTSEDNISRIGLGLSMSEGAIIEKWNPTILGDIDANIITERGKTIRGKTMFKDDLLLFFAMANQYQELNEFTQSKNILTSHWERGIEILTMKANGKTDWIEIVNNLL